MRVLLRCSVLLLGLVFPWMVASAADPSPGPLPDVPASLKIPDSQTLAFTLKAKGVQIYDCQPVPGEAAKFAWTLKAPDAELFDLDGKKVGHHFAGPTWELMGGGKVVGRLKAKADSPDGKGVAWLLLEATQTSGGGNMATVASIQRINTVGGKPPTEEATPAKAGQERRVEYTATYCFYAAKP